MKPYLVPIAQVLAVACFLVALMLDFTNRATDESLMHLFMIPMQIGVMYCSFVTIMELRKLNETVGIPIARLVSKNENSFLVKGLSLAAQYFVLMILMIAIAPFLSKLEPLATVNPGIEVFNGAWLVFSLFSLVYLLLVYPVAKHWRNRNAI